MKNLIAQIKTKPEPKKKIGEKPKVEQVIPEPGEDAVSLMEAYEKLLSKDKKFWKESKTLTASNTNPCLRFMGYRFFGYEHHDNISAQLQRIFDNGHAVHERITKYTEALGIVKAVEHEFRIEDPVPMHGFIDLLIDWNGTIPVEIKSINEAGFMYRKSFNKPSDDHFRQIQIYMHALDADRGVVLYENKSSQEILAISVKRDDKYLERLFKKYRAVYSAYKEGNLSIRPYKRTSQACQRCSAQAYCWDVDSEVGVKIG